MAVYCLRADGTAATFDGPGGSLSVPLFANPAARGGRMRRRMRRLGELARARSLELVVPAGGEDLTERCRRAAEGGADRVLVAGGDGSFHCALRGLAGTRCALGLVPGGTGNDLAESLGIPRRLEAALDLALGGRPRAIDLGDASERPFGVYCGVGFDSEAALWIDRRPTKGKLIYVAAALRTMLRFLPPEIRVEHDAGVFEGPAMLAVAANCYRFGGGMRIAPEARPDDGFLDLVIVRKISRLTLLALLPRVFSGGHVGHPAVEIVRTRRARIRLDREVRPALDGEIAPEPTREVRLGVRPRALRVVTDTA